MAGPGWRLAWVLCLCTWFLLTPPSRSYADSPSPESEDIEVFASPRCPHCHAAKLFLEQLQRERPDLIIRLNNVDEDTEARELPWWSYYGYLGLYNLAYILDDAVMVTIAVVTLQHRILQERAGRWLKLMSGLVMLALGGVLLAKPEWLVS